MKRIKLVIKNVKKINLTGMIDNPVFKLNVEMYDKKSNEPIGSFEQSLVLPVDKKPDERYLYKQFYRNISKRLSQGEFNIELINETKEKLWNKISKLKLLIY